MPGIAFAHASIDWAVSKLPAFQEKMQAWVDLNVALHIKQIDSDPAHNMLVALDKASPPLSFSVETGAYINSIRSSLDILATALAYRSGMPNRDNVHFPIAKSEAAFLAGNYKGAEFVNRLPPTHRQKIELLKPYEGGNRLLWQLHHLDIVRKHRKLLKSETRPYTLTAFGAGAAELLRNPIPHSSPSQFVHLNGETELGLVSKWAHKGDFKITAQITIAEPGCLYGCNVIDAIICLANMARDIIKSLDRP